MRTLTRPQRQVVATLMLLAGFVGPTGGAIWYVWHVRQPTHRQAVEAELTRVLGLPVRVESVTYPKPGVSILRGVQVQVEGGSARAGGSPLVRAKQVRLTRHADRWVAQAEGLELAAASPRQVVGPLGLLIRSPSSAPRVGLDLTASECTVRLGNGLTYSIQDLASNLRLDPEGPRLSSSYRLASSTAAQRCELELSRTRSQGESITHLTLRTTGEKPVSTDILSPFFDAPAWLGADATVQGTLELEQRGGKDWSASFEGNLAEVDLRSLLGRVAPEQQMTGRGEIRIARALWEDVPGRGPGWVEASGSLVVAQGGAMPRTLIESMAAELRFRPGTAAAGAGPRLEYGALGLAFELGSDGSLKLDGDLGASAPAGVVAVSPGRGSPLILAPEGGGTVTSLVRALVPGGLGRPEELIPARPESLAIQRYLPSPARVASETSRRAN